MQSDKLFSSNIFLLIRDHLDSQIMGHISGLIEHGPPETLAESLEELATQFYFTDKIKKELRIYSRARGPLSHNVYTEVSLHATTRAFELLFNVFNARRKFVALCKRVQEVSAIMEEGDPGLLDIIPPVLLDNDQKQRLDETLARQTYLLEMPRHYQEEMIERARQYTIANIELYLQSAQISAEIIIAIQLELERVLPNK